MNKRWQLLLHVLFIVSVTSLCVWAGALQTSESHLNPQQVKLKKQTQVTSQQALEARILKKLKASASFPPPKYDSGWLKNSEIDNSIQLNHGIGGNADRYFVDVQMKYTDKELGISNTSIGGRNGIYLVKLGDIWPNEPKNIHVPAAYPRVQSIRGAYYSKLTNRTIYLNINPGSDEGASRLAEIESVRVRIWAY